MKIALGAALRGFKLKEHLKQYLVGKGYEIVDVGTYNDCDFAKYTAAGERIAYALYTKAADLAIGFCGSGTGIAIAANKYCGVIACACESTTTAAQIRKVNGANCLCMGENMVAPQLACEMTEAFLAASFGDGAGNLRPEIRAFWDEARCEMLNRGQIPVNRELEIVK